MKKLNLLVTLVLLAGAALAQTTWKTDKAHTNIGFTITHMVVTDVSGSFKDFEATAVSKSDDFAGAEITFTAKTASINTENENRDNDLRSDSYFSAEKFPEIKFKGTIVKEGDKYSLKGDFTIKDVTKPVVFDVTYKGTVVTARGAKAGFKVRGTINRFDYNIKSDRLVEGGGLVLSKEVEILCNVALVKPK